MKRLVESIVWISIALVIGFALGRATANRGRREVLNSQQPPQQQPQTQQQIYAVGVDCYDKDGNLVHGMAEKYGGVTTACATGQFARLKQPNPPAHINVP